MAKNLGNNSFRTRQRMERAARLETMGIPDPEIARQVGLTYAGLAQMKMRNDYKSLRLQIATGVLSEIDSGIADDIGELRQRVRENVPLAIQAIIDTISQKTDPKLRLQAAETLLDRDGRFTKATRVDVNEISDTQKRISEKDDKVAKSLITALGATRMQSDKVQ